MIEGGRVFLTRRRSAFMRNAAPQARSVRIPALGNECSGRRPFGLMPQQAKFFFVRHPLLTCAPQKSAGERTQGTLALEVRSSEIGFGRAESPEAFAPADSFSERDGRPEGSSWLFPSWKKSAGTLRAPWQMKDFFSDNSIPSTASSRARLRLLRAPEGEA